PSAPLPNFSIETVGAPSPPHGINNPSSGSSSRSRSGTGPCSSTACRDISRPVSGSPPPPVPSTAHPRARSGRFPASSSTRRRYPLAEGDCNRACWHQWRLVAPLASTEGVRKALVMAGGLPQLGGDTFITDGGLETTLVFRKEMELPCFAAFPLLESAEGLELLHSYFDAYLALAADHGFGLLVDAPTWRASEDWGRQLGYSRAAIADVNRRGAE